ncbi:MAG TPA: energy transducer TonB [Armatimonadota bacterium]|nr:energy transducer TonB [Armatimonadota bacterium]
MPRRLSRSAVLLAAAFALAACQREKVPMTPPKQVSADPFQYPEELWDAGVEGRTVLRLFINAEGRVDSAAVDTTSGHAAFDSAAVADSRKLRFEPARRGEETVSGWFLLPVNFELTDEARAEAGARTDTTAEAATPGASPPAGEGGGGENPAPR